VESFRQSPFFGSSRAEYGRQGTEPFLLKAREAAQRLAISERHLYQLTSSGELPCVRIGKLVRYSVATLRKWIKDRESTEHPQLPRKAQPKRPAVQPRQAPVPRAAPKRRSPAGKKPVSAPEPSDVQGSTKTVSDRGRSDAQSVERSSRLSQFLKGKGIALSEVPPLTNGELRQIAGVDLVQWHGWQHLGNALPDEALERLTHHFQRLASSPRPR
jgi:excisionase family DNA binding protein